MRGRSLVAAAVLSCGLLAAIVGTPASADPEFVNGHFVLEDASGPDCSGYFGICMTGSVSGRIKGTFSFSATSIVSTVDTPATGAIVTTGDATVETKDGTISCKLTGTLQVNEDGPFVGLCVITGGTEDWTGVTGFLRTTGTFAIGTGGEGSYDGKVVVS